MKVVVVVRHLPPHDPVVMEVIKEDKERIARYDDPVSYLESAARYVVDEFKEKFPEFEDAKFIIKVLNC